MPQLGSGADRICPHASIAGTKCILEFKYIYICDFGM